MIEYRELAQRDLDGLRQIDRSDFSPSTYCVRHGELILENREFRHTGFAPEEWERLVRKFSAELEKGATYLFGAFDGTVLVGISGLEADRFCGPARDMLNMGPMWVTAAYRRRGIGRELLEMTRQKARDIDLGARALYVSATPARSTVDFYLRAGSQLLGVPDRDRFDEEPDDIHMGLDVQANKTDAGDA